MESDAKKWAVYLLVATIFLNLFILFRDTQSVTVKTLIV